MTKDGQCLQLDQSRGLRQLHSARLSAGRFRYTARPLVAAGAPPQNYARGVGFAKSRAELEASRGYGSSLKSVCPDHVDDGALKQLIIDCATESSCGYCDRTGGEEEPIAVPLEDFMEMFMAGVHHFYARADDEGVLRDEGEYVGAAIYSSEDVADDVFYAALNDYPDGAQDELLEDIQAIMAPDSWVRTNWLWPAHHERLSDGWEAFKELVKHQTRFLFTRWPEDHSYSRNEMSPVEFFDSLVKLLDNIPELIVDLDAPIYRGRMYLEEPVVTTMEADDLGPAPVDKAAANRMSPAGISMFYGATDIDTAVAEIGAHSAHSWAVVGEFTACQVLHVIDLSNLPALPSIFDSNEKSKTRYEAVSFLRKFVSELTLPIVLDGREHIDYVPTQVFTEFLRYAFPEPLDGMLFPSAQSDGRNVVLFSGPGTCAARDGVGPDTRFVLTPDSIKKYRVKTVIRSAVGI